MNKSTKFLLASVAPVALAAGWAVLDSSPAQGSPMPSAGMETTQIAMTTGASGIGDSYRATTVFLMDRRSGPQLQNVGVGLSGHALTTKADDLAYNTGATDTTWRPKATIDQPIAGFTSYVIKKGNFAFSRTLYGTATSGSTWTTAASPRDVSSAGVSKLVA